MTYLLGMQKVHFILANGGSYAMTSSALLNPRILLHVRLSGAGADSAIGSF